MAATATNVPYLDYTGPGVRPAATSLEALAGQHPGLILPAGWLPPGDHAPEELAIIAACGFPTGRHHSLIKAAEARLAVQLGATAVWLATQPAHPDPSGGVLLADIMATREAVPEPVALIVGVEAQLLSPAGLVAAARTAVLAGAQGIGLASGWYPGASAGATEVSLVREAVGNRLKVFGPVGSGADIELVAP